MSKGRAKYNILYLSLFIASALITVLAILFVNNKPKTFYKPKRTPAPFVHKSRNLSNDGKWHTFDPAPLNAIEISPSLGFRTDEKSLQQYSSSKADFKHAREIIKDIPFFVYDNYDQRIGGLVTASNHVAIEIQHKVATNQFDDAESAINDHVAYLKFIRTHSNMSVREHGQLALSSLQLTVLENLSTHPTTQKHRQLIRSWLSRCNATGVYPASETINQIISQLLDYIPNANSRSRAAFAKYYKKYGTPAPPYPENQVEDTLMQFARQLQIAATQGDDYSPEQIIALQTVLNQNRIQPSLVDPVSVALQSEVVNLYLLTLYTDQVTYNILNFHLDLLDFVEEYKVLPQPDQIRVPDDPYLKVPMKFALKGDPSFEAIANSSYTTHRRLTDSTWVISTPIHPVFTFGTEGTMMPENGSYFGGVPPQMLEPNANSAKVVK